MQFLKLSKDIVSQYVTFEQPDLNSELSNNMKLRQSIHSTITYYALQGSASLKTLVSV